MLNTFFEKHGKQISYDKGTIIVDCNETPNGIYYLEQGYVKASSLTERGREHVYGIFKSGEIFPVRWSFTSIKGDAVYTAVTNVTAWKADKTDFTSFISNNTKMLQLALEYSNTILDILVNRVNDLEHMNAYLRVASRLLSLAKRFGLPHEKGILIQVPMTQQDLASSIALSRESVSREISKLENKNLIQYQNQLILITDIHQLEEEIKQYPE